MVVGDLAPPRGSTGAGRPFPLMLKVMVSLCSTDDAQDEGVKNQFLTRIHHLLIRLLNFALRKATTFKLTFLFFLFVLRLCNRVSFIFASFICFVLYIFTHVHKIN